MVFAWMSGTWDCEKKSNWISITYFWLELISKPCFKPALSSLFKKICCPFSNIWPIKKQFPKSSFLVGQKWLIFLHTYDNKSLFSPTILHLQIYFPQFLTLKNPGFLVSQIPGETTYFGKCRLKPPNFHFRPSNSISYESWHLQLKFDTLVDFW